MTTDWEIEQLRRKLAEFERNSQKTSWLVGQIKRKICNSPGEILSRMKRSFGKRRRNAILKAQPIDFKNESKDFSSKKNLAHPGANIGLHGARAFFMSDTMMELVERARALEPEIGVLQENIQQLSLPEGDSDYTKLCSVLKLIPATSYDAIVLVPAGRMGGADLVAAVLARALSQAGRTLILRTDDKDWDCPHWYPESVDIVDISEAFKSILQKERALYVLLTKLAAPKIFNVNSRLAFQTYLSFGRQLSRQYSLYAYYFCMDRTPEGYETGYPVWYFHPLLRYLDAALIDTCYLANLMVERYAIPEFAQDKIKTVYTPSQVDVADPPMSHRNSELPVGSRPRILWGGRLDRQKRFDLAREIAAAMPDVDFICWGKAVLDAENKALKLPSNMTLNAPFQKYSELPLDNCTGWLYTSEWDGLPTILIELGAFGVPIVASAVGGVPELIDDTTGWPVPEDADVAAYVVALREMISNPALRKVRSRALQARVAERHSMDNYATLINSL